MRSAWETELPGGGESTGELSRTILGWEQWTEACQSTEESHHRLALFSLLFLLVFHSCLENTYDPSTQGPTGVSCWKELCQCLSLTNSALYPAPTYLPGTCFCHSGYHYPHSCPTIGPDNTLTSLQDFIFIKTLLGIFTMPHSIQMTKLGPRKARWITQGHTDQQWWNGGRSTVAWHYRRWNGYCLTCVFYKTLEKVLL